MAKKGCPTPGCRGLGHVRGHELPSHKSFADCPYSPQNINNDGHKPDRLQSMRGHRRSISTESEKIEVDDPDPDFGRGNRKRKKRKFFDGETMTDYSKKIKNGLHNMIRNDVFNPDQSQSEQHWDQNASFLKPMTQMLTPAIVRTWTPSEVAKFLFTLPIKLQSDMIKLENKIIDEEIDGEAFLLMTQSDFKQVLGVKLGPAIKIFNALLLIKKSS